MAAISDHMSGGLYLHGRTVAGDHGVWHAWSMRAPGIGLAIVLGVAGAAAAGPTARPPSATPLPPLDGLQRVVPAGWRVVVHPTALVIRRVAPVRIVALDDVQPRNSKLPIAAPPGTEATTFELRYRLEPAWSARKLAAARAANAAIDAAIAAARARYRLDAPPATAAGSAGRARPALHRDDRAGRDDRAARQAAFDAEAARLAARRVEVPRCTIAGRSLFGTDERALDLIVDPPAAMREAYAIVALIARRCR